MRRGLALSWRRERGAAIRSLAAKLAAVSRERVRDELTKMLTEGHARRAFELLDETGLLAEVLPEVGADEGRGAAAAVSSRGRCVGAHAARCWSNWSRAARRRWPGARCCTMWASRRPSGEAERIRFDGHVEVGVAMAAEICRRFRFSNDETRQMLALVENHMRFMDAQRMKASTLKRFFRLERL